MAKPKSDFWSWVDKTNNCWLWTGGLRSKNSPYGCWRENGKSVLAHRVAYEMTIGLIPEKLTVDHLCKNTECVNPSHMELVTLSENVKRSKPWLKGGEMSTKLQLAKLACPKGHAYSEENTYKTSKQRHCKTCRNEAQKRAYWNRKNHE